MRAVQPLLWCALPLALMAQYPAGQYPTGQYPPNTYPPVAYPPNTYPNTYPPSTYPGPMGVPIPVPSVHLPSRKGKTPKDAEAKVNVSSADGTLRQLSEKELLLQMQGSRVLRFRLLAKTQFRDKEGRPVRDSLLHPGDRLTVDANADDPETALFVILVRAGTKAERQSASAPVETSSIATPEASDLGKAHAVSDPAASPASPSAPPAAAQGSSTVDDQRPVLIRQPLTDDVIADARAVAASFTSGLPNYVAEQVTTRYQGVRYLNNWQALDVVTAEVVMVDGKEEYRGIRVNGRPTASAESTGSWSTGEFSTTLQDVLSPATAAVFTFRRAQTIADRPAMVYDLAVEQTHSHWGLVAPGGNRYFPAYKGSIWIDKETRRVLRIEQQAVGLPSGFEYDKAESTLEYGFVMIEGRQYLLPVRSDNQACMAGSLNCSRNQIEFQNYRRFGSDTKITFDQFRQTASR